MFVAFKIVIELYKIFKLDSYNSGLVENNYIYLTPCLAISHLQGRPHGSTYFNSHIAQKYESIKLTDSLKET
jgi:hypothetical protein